MVTVDGDRLRIDFTRFGIPEYDVFLRAKRLPESVTEFNPEGETYTITAPARFAPMLGVDLGMVQRADLPLAECLFDDQRAIVSMALDAKRFACWSDCGLGKSLIGLEWARQVVQRTGGRVLIVTMNEIVNQWHDESAKFYGIGLPIARILSRQGMREWMKDGPGSLGITNYEKWNPESLDRQIVTEARHLAGIVLDESHRLRTGGGKQKWALIKSCRGIEYKLSLTATPAPNDTMEFASQASFLEKMRSENEIIWTFFRRDEKTHRWTVKRHARAAFFEFMAGWSIYVRDPKRYGWRLGMEEVPAPTVIQHTISMTDEQRKWLVRLSADKTGQMSLYAGDRDTNAIQRAKLSQVAKGFRYKKGEAARLVERIPSLKPAFVADLIRSEASTGAQVLVWTVFDAEGDILAELLGKKVAFEILSGKTKEEDRLRILDAFRRGECRVLISKALMLGHGMNFQFCTSMIFSGWNDSYVAWYQAVRRAYRFGQKESVRVHVPVIPELEGDQLDNIFRKAGEHEAGIAEMEANYVKAKGTLEGRS